MGNEVKVVVGANYGDEGKGLMSRHFVLDAQNKHMNPIVIFHNGTAQRGHTVDYTPAFRHVYHHFGSGTSDGAPTYFADTFYVHPMEFVREYEELMFSHIKMPRIYCSIDAPVITPYDMLVDHMTMDYIAICNGEREHGTCGYGSWCAIESPYRKKHTVGEFCWDFAGTMSKVWNECMQELYSRKIDADKIPQYMKYFNINSPERIRMFEHFRDDFSIFRMNVKIVDYDYIWKNFDYHVFENGQGLGLDKDVKNDWHTTSKTGIYNPYEMIKDKNDFNAEVCYVTRSYLTRHGKGPLEEAVQKAEINANMHDATNVHNEFQGGLRYGYLEDNDQRARIEDDWITVCGDVRFNKSMAITHCNEFECGNDNSKYFSNNKFSVLERK